jgi:hypothetical protein
LTLRGVSQAAVSGAEVVDHVRQDAGRSVEPYWRLRTKDAFGILLSADGQPRCISDTSSGVAMKLAMKFALKVFFLPGDIVADLLGATQSDDRVMIRTLVDMLFWNAVVVIVALVIFL